MEYHQKNLRLFHSNATHIVTALSAAHGLTPIMPKATMYCMVRPCDDTDEMGGPAMIDGITCDVVF